jgi:hypothetical protein
MTRLVTFALFALLAAVPLAGAEVEQKGDVRVDVSGSLSPQRLPRQGMAPITVVVGGKISGVGQSPTPTLKSLRIELNKNGHIDTKGLPVCPYVAIQPASSQRALSACRSSLVGKGSFSAEISLTGQEPYPTKGTLLAFNGREGGKPVLFGQIYAARPFATSFVIVFSIGRAKGKFGTSMSAKLPPSLLSWGNLTGIELRLSRRYTSGGKRHSYVSAGCPAPPGFPGASFPFARTSFGFQGGPTLSTTLERSCKARG